MTHLGNNKRGVVCIVFNPIDIILKEDNTQSINEEQSLKDVYYANVDSIANAVSDCHKSFIDASKKILWKLRKKEAPKHVSIAELMAYKVDKFTNSICSILCNRVDKNAMYLLKYIQRTDYQIHILKKILSNPNYRAFGDWIYFCKGVGFKTIDLPSIQEYSESISIHIEDYKKDDLIRSDVIIDELPKIYQTESALQKEMYDKIQYIFKEDTPYKIKEYVNVFDTMNKDLKDLLQKHKEQYISIKKLLNKVHDTCTEGYTDYMKSLEKEEDNEQKKDIATKNYNVLSNNIIQLVDMITVFHRIQIKIIFMSYENYKEVISSIYTKLSAMAFNESNISILEDKLSTSNRNKMNDKEFGIPELRKYPLHDESHVRAAIRLFPRGVPSEYEEKLAHNIIRKMKEYNIPEDSIGPNNKLRQYL